VSVAVGKIPGVEKVNVSLNKALVTIDLEPGNTVCLDQIRKAILNDAFTPKDATVIVIGQVTEISGKSALRVSGTDRIYEVVPSPSGQGAFERLTHEQGKTVSVQGLIPAPPKRGESVPRLLVGNFSEAK